MPVFDAIKLSIQKSIFQVQKFSPQILMGVGIAGMAASTILAARATLGLDEALKPTKENLDKIKQIHKLQAEGKMDAESYDLKKETSDKTIIYIQAATAVSKLYAPAFLAGVGGAACILAGNHILSKRTAATAAALTAATEKFREYRERVAEKYGDEAERDIRLDVDSIKTTREKKIVDPETGEETTVNATDIRPDASKISIYARYFDRDNINWNDDNGYNSLFLQTQQSFANDRLHARGHIFLNEVYDMLGIEHSREGAVVGWLDSGDGDGYVDFGIWDPDNIHAWEMNQRNYPDDLTESDIIQGYRDGSGAHSFLLDFNVDGAIWDRI